MSIVHLIILALVQGITEFLPVSSSGHLILIPYLTDWPDQGLAIDVAVHIGSLAAILVYYARDVWALGRGGFALFGVGRAPVERRWVLFIIAGTIPAVAVGLAFKAFDVMDHLRLAELVAINLILYGVLLWFADRIGREEKSFEDLSLRDAILVGLAQALALIPGTSRSGVTMTAARMLGYKRPEAARFSFLLSIPAIAGAGLLVGLELGAADVTMQKDALIAGVLTFFAALATMAFLMRWLTRATFTPFVVYRILLGIVILWWATGA